MDCYVKKYNLGTCIIIFSIIVLLLWNIGLTIAIGNNNNNTSNTECYCVEQMRNTLGQIARLYPDNQLFITLDSGDDIIGTAGEITLGPNGKSGIFEIKTSQENSRQFLSICSIDTITINDAVYNEEINYLPEPNPEQTDCKADCDDSIRQILPVGTMGTSIITNTQITSQGDVIINVPGMIVLENTERNNITFVSTCRIDAINLTNESE